MQLIEAESKPKEGQEPPHFDKAYARSSWVQVCMAPMHTLHLSVHLGSGLHPEGPHLLHSIPPCCFPICCCLSSAELGQAAPGLQVAG